MSAIAAEDLSPWCKFGNAVFRAIEVEDRGAVINVSARVKDDAVAQALEAARGDRWNRGAKGRFAWSGRSKYVKVSGVHVTTTTARSKMFRLELELDEAPQDTALEFSVGGMTPAGDIPDISATYSKIPTVFRWLNLTSTLAAQNLRTGSGPLAAGAYRVGVIISPSPTGSATVQATVAWTDVRGNSLTYGLGFSGSSALPTQVSLNIEVDGVHDVTIAVVSVTGTITFNITAVE